MVLPFFYGKIYISNPIDFPFHITRAYESYLNIKDGNLFNMFPKMMTHTFGEFGYFQNSFYPIYFLTPLFLLRFITSNMYTAYLSYLIFINFLIFISMYFCSKKITNKNSGAYLSSLLYGFSYYKFTDMFFRQDIGETIVFIFLPIILYGVYEVFFEDFRKWYLLTLGFSGVILSNIPSIFITLSFIIVFIFLIFLFYKIEFKRFYYLIFSGIFSLCITSFFLIPFLYNFIKLRPFSIQQENPNPYVSSISVNELFFNFLPINPIPAASAGIGIFLFVVLIIAIYNWNKLSVFNSILLLVSLIFCVISTNLFPWFLINKVGQLFQFPFRFLLIPTLTLSFLGGILIDNLLQSRNKRILYFSFFIFILGFNITQNYFLKRNYQAINYTYSNFDKKISSTPIFDYVPKKSISYLDNIKKGSIEIMNPNKDIKQISQKNGYNNIKYKIYLNSKYKNVLLPNINYSGTKLKIDGIRSDLKVSKENIVSINLDEGKHDIEIYYGENIINKISNIISIISLLLVGWIPIYRFKNRNKFKN